MKILLVSADRSAESGVPINLGDALLTDALAAAIRHRGHDVTVADFGGTRAVGGGSRSRTAGLWGLFRAIRRCDAIVIGGGTLLQDDNREVQVGGLPRLLFAVSMLGWMARTEAIYFAVGCDPVERRIPRLLLRLAVLGRKVWVRDVESAERCLISLGVAAELAADASFLLFEELKEQSRSASCAESRLVVALNRTEARQLSAAQVQTLKSRFGAVVFVSMDQGHDGADANSLSRDAAMHFDQITEDLGWEGAVSAFAGASEVFASRMHAMYIAAMVGVPMAAVGTAPKVDAFAREFGIPRMELTEDWPGSAQIADPSAIEAARIRVTTQLDNAMRSL